MKGKKFLPKECRKRGSWNQNFPLRKKAARPKYGGPLRAALEGAGTRGVPGPLAIFPLWLAAGLMRGRLVFDSCMNFLTPFSGPLKKNWAPQKRREPLKTRKERLQGMGGGILARAFCFGLGKNKKKTLQGSSCGSRARAGRFFSRLDCIHGRPVYSEFAWTPWAGTVLAPGK